jgi:hypothetical protein
MATAFLASDWEMPIPLDCYLTSICKFCIPFCDLCVKLNASEKEIPQTKKTFNISFATHYHILGLG